MDDDTNTQQAVDLLQQLGLKEYEARCLVALTRLPEGTAKEISEASEVPRTRVYDAVRVLETKGLVEVQHSNPQQFRAVSVDEAAQTLRAEYEARTDSLRETLREIPPLNPGAEEEAVHEVWALSGGEAVAARTLAVVEEATDEVVLIVGVEDLFTAELAEALAQARDRGVNVLLGTTDEEVRERVSGSVPDAEVFVSGLEWLSGDDDGAEIGRLLLVDRSTILVSSFRASGAGTRSDERAVFGTGFDNGLVVITRRLMATGLLPTDDPRDG
ncbi:MAG: TrmB family transcriptional regulator [Haloferacaceae archaeon]